VIKVLLDRYRLELCKSHALRTVKHYSNYGWLGSGSYNHNNVGSNLVGIKSEMATKIWLGRKGFTNIQCGYEKLKHSGGDLTVRDWPIEVKGLRPHQWEGYKRCVPPKQLDKYVRRNAVVVWTTTTGDTRSGAVSLHGWNYATDVHLKGVPRTTICDNVWLENDEDMRLMGTLITTIKRGNAYQTELPLTQITTIKVSASPKNK
jgi:hypothetical protein